MEGLESDPLAVALADGGGPDQPDGDKLVGSECYFVLGVTNDTDGGGWSDAFERLVSHTDPDNPDDDRATPWVGLMAVGSVALEQYPTNTPRGG
jgi:hypothetical protein